MPDAGLAHHPRVPGQSKSDVSLCRPAQLEPHRLHRKEFGSLKAEVYSSCIPFMVYVSVLWGAKTHFKLSIWQEGHLVLNKPFCLGLQLS